jgi:uncharacterized protein
VNFRLDQHTIFMALAGSQAHGTAREGSDVDLRGVCVAPIHVRLSLFATFEQYEGPLTSELETTIRPRLEAHSTASRAMAIKIECVVFDIAKFLALCTNANPNALELLFADEKDWAFETPAWRRLHNERNRFLTKKVRQTFLGYAMAQLKKIRTHRAWLLQPPARQPSREDFGLPATSSALSRDDQNRIEQSIADRVRAYGVDDVAMLKHTRIAVQERMDGFIRDMLAVPAEEIDERIRAVAMHSLNLPPDVVVALNAEKRYRAAAKHWESYQTWQRQRNPARAELERQHGYDTKHAMHLVRLMRMGLEALQRGELLVRRPDAVELAAIRDGALSYDELIELATRLQADMERAATSTNLPEDVDSAAVDELAFDLMTGSGS